MNSLLFPKYVALNKKYGVQNRSKFMLCYYGLVDSKKGSPLVAAELAKQPQNYKHRTETSVQQFEQKPVKEQEQEKSAPSTPKSRKMKSAVGPLKAKQQRDIKRQKREVKKHISSRNCIE